MMMATQQKPATAESLIEPFNGQFAAEIGPFISFIQRDELNVAITLAEQPDLNSIAQSYQAKGGNFWTASHDGQLVGTLAVIHVGNGIGVLRKMFVHRDWRGAPHFIAQRLFDTMLAWLRTQQFQTLYLGTVPQLTAACRFYEKNGFVSIPMETLPPSVDAIKIAIDSLYFRKELSA